MLVIRFTALMSAMWQPACYLWWLSSSDPCFIFLISCLSLKCVDNWLVGVVCGLLAPWPSFYTWLQCLTMSRWGWGCILSPSCTVEWLRKFCIVNECKATRVRPLFYCVSIIISGWVSPCGAVAIERFLCPSGGSTNGAFVHRMHNYTGHLSCNKSNVSSLAYRYPVNIQILPY